MLCLYLAGLVYLNAPLPPDANDAPLREWIPPGGMSAGNGPARASYFSHAKRHGCTSASKREVGKIGLHVKLRPGFRLITR
uniref:Uncharacterized protein n=1 Tax=Aquisalinus luteolus TaxID=1566827 RepID=A0A8J3A0X6_9PROT|nr:hypothetical protein GCM10011355_08420 [Aquisalinus luteolus]